MKGKRPYFLLQTLFLVIFTCFVFLTVSAQSQDDTQFGISFSESFNASEVTSELPYYQELGIELLEFQHPVPVSLLDTLSRYPFQVLVRTDHRFLTTSELLENNTDFILEVQSMLENYDPYNVINAIGLFSYSQPNSEVFEEELNRILLSVQDSIRFSFYEVSSSVRNSGIASIIEITSSGFEENSPYYILNKTYQPSDFELVNSLFSETTATLFFDSQWFSEATSEYPDFLESLKEFQSTGDFILPLPETEPPSPSFSWAILVFVFIWILVGIHLKAVPTYRDTMFRYFTFHRFFVDDIMRFRERSALSGTFLLLQHALFTGLLTYILAVHYLSAAGLEALFHHAPLLAVFGKNYFSLFSVTIVVTFLVELIGLFWLYFPSKSMQHFSQAVNLYSWIFHTDFLIISVMLILLLTNSGSTLIPFLAVGFVLNWLIGFGLCGYDSSKYLLKKRAIYLFYTVGLHTLVNVLLLVFILTNHQLLDFLSLITSL